MAGFESTRNRIDLALCGFLKDTTIILHVSGYSRWYDRGFPRDYPLFGLLRVGRG